MVQNTFFIGAATAAHQVEGNNIHSDFWAQEQMKNTSFNEPSLDACDHYNRYEEDILLMKEAGLNAYRFSIEWARIEPVKGTFDRNEMNHYQKVIDFCIVNGIEPIITLHHFSSPKWLMAEGGWESEKVIEYFANYSKYVIENIGDKITYICTINELNMGLQIAAIAKRYMKQMNIQIGMNMPGMGNQEELTKENIEVFGIEEGEQINTFTTMRTANGDLISINAHCKARDEIKKINPNLKVGTSLSLHDLQLFDDSDEAKEELNHTWNEEFLHYLPYIKEDDFLGVQNYSRELIGANGVQNVPEGNELTQMNYEYYPEGIGNVLRKVADEFKGELIVTENGIATADDSRRVAFIDTALKGVQACINDGLNVRGYFYWSLLDNFEWQKGFSMTFGLIEIDRSTQKRTPKPSLKFLGSRKF